MANLKPEDYFKVRDFSPIRSARIRIEETPNADGTPAKVEFLGENDRFVFLAINKRLMVQMMTFMALNGSNTKVKQDETIASIKIDSTFVPIDYTEQVKAKLGKKYADVLKTDPKKADEFITQYVMKSLTSRRPAYVSGFKIIQTPWDTNVVPPQEVKKTETTQIQEPEVAPVEESPQLSATVKTPTTEQGIRIRGDYTLEVVKPLPDTSKVESDEPKDKKPLDDPNKQKAAQEDTKKETTKKTTESENGNKVAETKDVNTQNTQTQPGDTIVDSNGKPINRDTEKPVDESKNKEAVLKVVGPNGNLVLFPDGTRRDLGELTVVSAENPYDPKILAILNYEYEVTNELDEEYVEEQFFGNEEEQLEIASLQMKIAAEDMKDYEEFNKIWQTQSDGGGGGGGGGFGAGSGSVSGTLNFTPDKRKDGRGCISKNNRTKDELVRIMFDYVEGGYYHPIIGWTDFSVSDRNLYGSSGETMWGLDRYAGQTEKNEKGAWFWAEIDKISGNGTYGKSGLARTTPTRKWNISANPKKAGSWKWGYEPSTSKGGELMKAAIEYAKARYLENLKANFGSGDLAQIIESDNRLQFMYFRATWNGPGWYQKYAKNLKKVFATVGKDIDKLIISDLNFRHSFSSSLIKHDAKIIARLIGAKN